MCYMIHSNEYYKNKYICLLMFLKKKKKFFGGSCSLVLSPVFPFHVIFLVPLSLSFFFSDSSVLLKNVDRIALLI